MVGVVELPKPYQDYGIILDKQCVGALLNDTKGTDFRPNIGFTLPSMEVHTYNSTRST